MPYRVNCPSCQTAYSISEDSLGRALLCKKCRKPFTVGKPKAAAPAASKPPRPSAPKATVGRTTTDLSPRSAAKTPPRRDAVQSAPASAAPPPQRKKSPILIIGVLAAVLFVLGGAVAGAIVAGIYFFKSRQETPIVQAPIVNNEPKETSTPSTNKGDPPADTKALPPPTANETAKPEPAPNKPDPKIDEPPSSPPVTETPRSPNPPIANRAQLPRTIHAARIKITNPRFTRPGILTANFQYEPKENRWVYSIRTDRSTFGYCYLDVLPPGAPTTRDAYAAKLLQKDPMGAGPHLTEIAEKGDLPDGFFIQGTAKDPTSAKTEPAFILVRKVNGAFLRCRNATSKNRPMPEDDLRQAMREVFELVAIRTTTLISLPPPSGAVMLRDNATLVVSHAETANLIYFDTMAEREIKRVEVDFQPGELIVQGDTLFAAAKGSALLYALEAATGKVKKEYNLGGDGIVHIACHPRSGLIYASTTKFGVVSLDPASGTVNKTKALGQFLAVSPGGKFLYTGVQPPDRDEIEFIFRRDGSVRLYSDTWGPRAVLMKYAVDGSDLRFVSGQNNAAVNGWWMHLTPDGKRLMMVSGGGWRPPKEGGTGGGYVTAVFRTDNLQAVAQQIPFSGLNTIFHPVLNLGVANSYGMFLTLFNGKSLVKRTAIELNKERESRPLLLMFGGKGRKLILWNGDNMQKEQGLHFLPLPLKPEEEAALAKAEKQPAAPEPEESAPPASSEKPAPTKEQAPKSATEVEAAIKKLGGSVQHENFDDKKPIVEVRFDGVKLTNDDLAVLEDLLPLKKLYLENNERITADGFKHLQKLTNLEVLSISRNKLTDDGLAKIKGFKKLTKLFLTTNQISDKGLVHLKDLPELTKLDLSFNQGISDAGIEHLMGLTKLKRLDVSGTRVSAKGKASLKKALPELTFGE